MPSKPRVVLRIAMIAMFGSVMAGAAEYPSKTIDFVVAGNAGGGLDMVGRELEGALRDAKLLKEAFVVKNIGGAGGNIAKNYVHQRKGDAHVLYLESNRVYLNRIVGTTHLSYTDVTPVARVMTEYLAWGVRAESPYKSAKEILEKAKADPNAVVFGVGTVPGNDQMNILRAAMAYGLDARRVKVLALKSSRDATIQVLGGHVPVVSSGVSELLERVKAGKMRLVAVSSLQPLPGDLASVPTWRSLGCGHRYLALAWLVWSARHARRSGEVLGAGGRARHEIGSLEEGPRASLVVRGLCGFGGVSPRSCGRKQDLYRGTHAAWHGEGVRTEIVDRATGAFNRSGARGLPPESGNACG